MRAWWMLVPLSFSGATATLHRQSPWTHSVRCRVYGVGVFNARVLNSADLL